MSVQNVNNCIDKVANLPREVGQNKAPLVKIHTVANEILCEYCKKEILDKKWCGGCKKVYYCNSVCQTSAWPSHKTECIKTKAVESVQNLANTLSIEDEKAWKDVFNSLRLFGKINCEHYDNIPIYSLPKSKDEIGRAYFFDNWNRLVNFFIDAVKLKVTQDATSFENSQTILLRHTDLIVMANFFANTIQKELKEQGFKNADLAYTKFKQLVDLYFKRDNMSYIGFNIESIGDLSNRLDKLNVDMKLFIYEKSKEIGFNNSIKKFQITDEKLKAFNTSKNDAKIDPGNFSCLKHALLWKSDTDAKDFIFNNDDSLTNPLGLLKKLRYKSEKSPCAGDLVVYFTDRGIATHVAECGTNGMVISKQGAFNPYIIEHSLSDVTIHHGNLVAFFRKIPRE